MTIFSYFIKDWVYAYIHQKVCMKFNLLHNSMPCRWASTVCAIYWIIITILKVSFVEYFVYLITPSKCYYDKKKISDHSFIRYEIWLLYIESFNISLRRLSIDSETFSRIHRVDM